MIEEALQYLVDLGKTARELRLVEDVDPREVVFVDSEGLAHRIDREPPARRHIVNSLDDLVAAAERYVAKESLSDSVVWFNESCVTLVIDDKGHRIDRVTFPLQKTEKYKTLEGLARSKQWIDQKALLRLLRIELNGTIPPAILLEKVKKVKFENGTTVNSQVSRDKESLGREINSRVDGEGQIPDEVALELGIYKGLSLEHQAVVRCSVDIDPARGLFQFMPMPDELARVEQIAMSDIGLSLASELPDGVVALYGSPEGPEALPF